jgi:hypothetical protein
VSSDIALEDDAPFLVQDAEVHSLCMKIDSAVVFVLLSVEIHIGLLCWILGLLIIPLCGILREALMSITRLKPTRHPFSYPPSGGRMRNSCPV